jgi:hypothetical protein
MEIPQDGPTGSHALENADDQNAIGLLSPKSHTNSYRMLSTWESMRFKFGIKTDVLGSAAHFPTVH